MEHDSDGPICEQCDTHFSKDCATCWRAAYLSMRRDWRYEADKYTVLHTKHCQRLEELGVLVGAVIGEAGHLDEAADAYDEAGDERLASIMRQRAARVRGLVGRAPQETDNG